jgi:hypothetical protein
VRVAVAIYAQLTFINGAWNVCEAYIFHNTWQRNVGLMAAGIALCLFAGTLVTNANIVPMQYMVFHQPNDHEEVSAAYRPMDRPAAATATAAAPTLAASADAFAIDDDEEDDEEEDIVLWPLRKAAPQSDV